MQLLTMLKDTDLPPGRFIKVYLEGDQNRKGIGQLRERSHLCCVGTVILS
jgi:hypothetical protein